MNSALLATLKIASTTAQSQLGQTITIDGANYTGVVQRGDPIFQPGPNGIERIEALTLVLTLDQFSAAPTAAPRANVVISGTRYWGTKVDADELHYFITCVPR